MKDNACWVGSGALLRRWPFTASSSADSKVFDHSNLLQGLHSIRKSLLRKDLARRPALFCRKKPFVVEISDRIAGAKPASAVMQAGPTNRQADGGFRGMTLCPRLAVWPVRRNDRVGETLWTLSGQNISEFAHSGKDVGARSARETTGSGLGARLLASPADAGFAAGDAIHYLYTNVYGRIKGRRRSFFLSIETYDRMKTWSRFA